MNTTTLFRQGDIVSAKVPVEVGPWGHSVPAGTKGIVERVVGGEKHHATLQVAFEVGARFTQSGEVNAGWLEPLRE